MGLGACDKFEANDVTDAGARDGAIGAEASTSGGGGGDGGDAAPAPTPPARLTCGPQVFCEDFESGTLDDIVTKWGTAPVGQEQMSTVPTASSTGLRCKGNNASQLLHVLTKGATGKPPTRVTFELQLQVDSAPAGTYLFKLSTGGATNPQQGGLAFVYDPSVGLEVVGVGASPTPVPNTAFKVQVPHLVQVVSSEAGTGVFVDGKGGFLPNLPLGMPPNTTQGLFLVVGPEIVGAFDVTYDDVKVAPE